MTPSSIKGAILIVAAAGHLYERRRRRLNVRVQCAKEKRSKYYYIFMLLSSPQMYLNNLTTNRVYDLKVQAATRSQLGERLMHFGPFSEIRRLLLQPGCEAMRGFAPRASSGGGPGSATSVILVNLEEHFGAVAGAVCGSLGILLAVLIFLVLRRYSQENDDVYYGGNPAAGAKAPLLAGTGGSPGGPAAGRLHAPTPELPGWDCPGADVATDDQAIPVHLFHKHVTELHMDQVSY
jgi:hypothetical protein